MRNRKIRGLVVWLSRAVAHDWAGGASKGAWGYINHKTAGRTCGASVSLCVKRSIKSLM